MRNKEENIDMIIIRSDREDGKRKAHDKRRKRRRDRKKEKKTLPVFDSRC